MTDILFEMLIKRFPPVNRFQRIGIYGAYERIYMNLLENFPQHSISRKEMMQAHAEFEAIAREIFDVPFRYEKQGTCDYGVYFEETKANDAYMKNYQGHIIEIHLPSNYPRITIWTGNRGAATLFDKQRQNYFQFVEAIQQTFRPVDSRQKTI